MRANFWTERLEVDDDALRAPTRGLKNRAGVGQWEVAEMFDSPISSNTSSSSVKMISFSPSAYHLAYESMRVSTKGKLAKANLSHFEFFLATRAPKLRWSRKARGLKRTGVIGTVEGLAPLPPPQPLRQPANFQWSWSTSLGGHPNQAFNLAMVGRGWREQESAFTSLLAAFADFTVKHHMRATEIVFGCRRLRDALL